MDKEKKEKLQEKINEVTEKVYDSFNIRGGLDNMYNVVDKIRNVTLITLIAIIVIMTSISIYTIIAMPKDVQIGEQSGIEYNNIIAKISTIDMKEEDINNYKVIDEIREIIPVKNKFKEAIHIIKTSLYICTIIYFFCNFIKFFSYFFFLIFIHITS